MKRIAIGIISIIGLVILITPTKTEAKTLQDLYNQLAKLQSQYNANQSNRNMTEGELNRVNNEINSINYTIEKTRKEIIQAEKDIEDSKEKIEDKKLETDGFIQFLQVSNGGNIYLEYLFDAENYTDFIYRYEVVKQLTNYNSDLIDELEQLIKDLQKKEKDLAAKQVTLENNRKELTKKVTTLSTSLASFREEGVDIAKDIEDMKKQIKIFEDLGCRKDQDLDSCTGQVNAYGWKYPLAKGCVTSEYTGYRTRTDWSGGGGHFGIDLDCVGEGTKVYAAAAGVVRRITRYSCGGNAVYIAHRVNGKNYTTVYMHLLSVDGSMYVGKVVTDSTVIGYVGGYSTSISHGGYDYCTTGTHLHFGMAEGDSTYNFNPYSINPREIFAFPKLVYSGGGYFSR